jgi:hypothetical protein
MKLPLPRPGPMRLYEVTSQKSAIFTVTANLCSEERNLVAEKFLFFPLMHACVLVDSFIACAMMYTVLRPGAYKRCHSTQTYTYRWDGGFWPVDL